MLGRAILVAVLTTFGIAHPVPAHDTIPADWCPLGSTPVLLSEFALSPDQLRQYRRAHEKERYEGCLTQKTCGIIDEWFWASEAAGAHCSALGLRSIKPEDAVPFVDAPKSFNVADHHALYRFDNGTLRGQCVVCRAVRTTFSTSSGAPQIAE